MKRSVEVLLPNHLPHGFDYVVPEGMQLSEGTVVTVPFGSREMPGVVWRDGDPSRLSDKLKPVKEQLAHLGTFSKPMREFIDWVAWYNFAPRGAVLKMVFPVAEALKAPGTRERPPKMQPVVAAKEVKLGADQQKAAEALAAKVKEGFSVTLLDGVTGSGKTEVYFDTIAKVIAEGGQALVLLPEISLSVQWLQRFEQRFGFPPHVWHSGLPAGRRKHTWRAAMSGEAKVIVGARSALFLPYPALKLVVVDEEHDGSYKQEDGVVYHARDMAVARGRFERIAVILASATPSLETLQNVSAGKYAALHLPDRHGGATMPDVQMIDMRSATLDKGAFIAQPLREALADILGKAQQSMLFLNRRGYAPLMLCRACGHRLQCPQCTSWLVMHKYRHESVRGGKATLHCHHCGYFVPQPERCSSCGAEDKFHACGPGVERVAEEVAAFLPQARVCVLASDSTESYIALQEHIHAIERGEIDIIIGTQMIAKGHHFDNLALVGVVDADLGLAGGDLRATERTYQLLHQLSGRAGRSKTSGKVLLQSFAPEHPVMKALLGGDRDEFMQLESEQRQMARMPPFARLAAMVIDGVNEKQTADFARLLGSRAPRLKEVQVLGPAPAPIYMLRGRYRQRLLIRAERHVNLQACLGEWLEGIKIPSSLRLKVDIDPYSFL